MEQRDLDALLTWKKQQFIKLNEVLTATQQLAQSLERNDSVSVNMWVAMREDPIQQAQELQTRIGDYLFKMPREDAIRANELLGGAEAGHDREKALCEQAARNRRLLDRIVELDKFVSRRLAGSHSFYNTYRE